MNTARRSFAALLATASIAVACGSNSTASTSCSSKGTCPNDPPPSPSEVSQCNALTTGKCGGLFNTYFACAAGQEKCTPAGTVDDAATKAAIVSNCASEVSAYQSCANPAPTCGLTGQSCCTSGTPCEEGCCDPGTQMCVMALAACSGQGQRCSVHTCTICGDPGQPCCGTLCVNGGCCTTNVLSTPGTCVAANATCPVSGDAGGGGAACVNGGCQSCGALNGLCCPGSTCVAANTQCMNGYCFICGVRNAACCAGNVCNDGTKCQQPFGCM